MKRMLIATLLITALSACGAKQSTDDDAATVNEQDTEEVEAETTETTETTEVEPATDPNKLPAPPDVAAPPANAESSDSGLSWVVLTPGDEAGSPTVASTVTVHYTGWTTDGEMFDSSVVRGEPATFPLAQLIKGWQEGIPLMSRGEKRRFWIPGELAYAGSSRPDAPKGLLVFDIELIDFQN